MTEVKDLKLEDIINKDNTIQKVIDKTWIKSGKGPAFIKLVTKNINNNIQNLYKLSTNYTVELMKSITHVVVFTYADEDNYYFSAIENGYQYHLLKKHLNIDERLFIYNNNTLYLKVIDNQVIKITLMEPILLTVQNIIKATSDAHTVILDYNITVNVPKYINVNDQIYINDKLEYAGRKNN